MLEAKFSQGSLLKKVVESVSGLLNEATWDCSDEGITLQAMDTSHVSLVSVNLCNEGFVKFSCDRQLSMGININSMTKILKCAANNDILTLTAGDGADKVNFVFESPNQDRVSEYELKLMDLEQEHLGIPDTDYDGVVKMSSIEFQKVVRDLSQFGDNLVISMTKEEINFSVSGDTGNCNVKLGQTVDNDKDTGVVIECKDSVSLTFACRYLAQFTKATSLSTLVTLYMSDQVPLMVEYNIKEKEVEKGHIRYYLAPKIEDD